MRPWVFLLAISLAAFGGFVLGRHTAGGPAPMDRLLVEERTPQRTTEERPSEGLSPAALDRVVEAKPLLPKPNAEPLAALAALRDQFPEAVKIPVLTKRDKIQDSFGELLGLSAAEIGSLNDHIAKARARLNEYSAANASLTVGPNGAIEIKVAPFDGGPGVYDELMEAFGKTLGEQRIEPFKRLFGDEFVEAFHQFGAQQRSLTIAETLPDYVDWRDGEYYIKDERRTAAGRLETMAYRFRADKMEYLFPHLKWLEPLIASRLPPLKSRPNEKPTFYEVTK